jgi:hypothetical protein
MGILRRTQRQVYRVYSEEEFLSDPTALSDWSASPAERVSRERRLGRLAGIAALTGVVGTVVGAIALAIVGSRPAALRATASATSRPAALRPASEPLRRAHGGRHPPAGHPGRTHTVNPRKARSVGGRRLVVRRQWTPWRSELPLRIDTAAPSATNASAEATAEPARRSEFGFER